MDRISYTWLIPIAILLAVVPFYPQPHLIEKLTMLMNGTLRRPIDIFDLFWHSWPLMLLGIKLVVDLRKTFSARSPKS